MDTEEMVLGGLQGLDISVLTDPKDDKTKTDDESIEPLISLGDKGGVPLEESITAREDVNKEEEGEEKEEEEKGSGEEIEEKETDVEEESEDAEEEVVGDKTKTTEEEKEEESPFRIIADMFVSQGTVSEIPEDFVEDADGIHQLIDAEIESRKQEWVDNLPENVKYLVNNWKEGVSLSELVGIGASIESYETIDKDTLKENEALQKSLIRDYLAKNGWDEKGITEEVEENENSGTLAAKAKRYLTMLIKDEKIEEAALIKQDVDIQRQRNEYYKAQVDGLKKTLKEKQEIVPGIKLTDRDRKIIFDGVTKFDKDKKNAIMRYREKNPDFDLMTSYLALILKGDFTKVDRAAVTKATKKLKNKMEGKGKAPVLKGVDINIMKKAIAAF